MIEKWTNKKKYHKIHIRCLFGFLMSIKKWDICHRETHDYSPSNAHQSTSRHAERNCQFFTFEQKKSDFFHNFNETNAYSVLKKKSVASECRNQTSHPLWQTQQKIYQNNRALKNSQHIIESRDRDRRKKSSS